MRKMEEIMNDVDRVLEEQDQKIAQHTAELDKINQKIKELRRESEKIERFNMYKDAADEIALMRRAFVESGFSKTEAMQLTHQMIDTVVKPQFAMKSIFSTISH